MKMAMKMTMAFSATLWIISGGKLTPSDSSLCKGESREPQQGGKCSAGGFVLGSESPRRGSQGKVSPASST